MNGCTFEKTFDEVQIKNKGVIDNGKRCMILDVHTYKNLVNDIKGRKKKKVA